MMVEIYNGEKGFIADARCLADVIALYLIQQGIEISLELGG